MEKSHYNSNNYQVEKVDYIFQYFFILGLDNDYASKEDIEVLKTKNPEILCEYWNEKEDENEYKTIKNLVKSSVHLHTTIFPLRADYLKDLDYSKDYDDVTNPHLYQEYIVVKKTKPKEIFNFFCFKSEGKTSHQWYFTCKIFYEMIQKKNKPVYAAKALVLVTHEEYFGLSKYILEEIFLLFKKDVRYPIETFIISCFNTFTNNDNPTLVLLKKKNYEIIEKEKKKLLRSPNKDTYLIRNPPLMNHFDINLGFFFNLFTLNDLFVLIDHFICSYSFIFTSNQIELLFPVYEAFLTLMSPIQKMPLSYYGKIFSPLIKRQVLDELYDTTILAYCDVLSNDILEKIAKKKYCKLIAIQIINQDKVIKTFIDGTNSKIKPLEKIQSRFIGEFFKSQSIEFKNFMLIGIKKIVDEYKISKQIFFQNGDNIDLRKYFFTLMIRFLRTMLSYKQVIYTNNKLIIELKMKNEIETTFPNIKEQYIWELIYNTSLYQEKAPSFLRRKILIDELLKMIEIDKKGVIIYYDLEKYDLASVNIVSLQSLIECQKESQVYYLNIFNRNIKRQKYITLEETEEAEEEVIKLQKLPAYYIFQNEVKNYFIHYIKYILYFPLFSKEPNHYNGNANKYFELYLEFEEFLLMLETNIIPFSRDKEYALAAIEIALGIIGLNEIQNKINIDRIEKTITNLIYFFNLYHHYFKKFDVALSLLFEILTSHPKLTVFIPPFIHSLIIYKVYPTIGIIIKNNKGNFAALNVDNNNPIEDNNVNPNKNLNFNILSLTKKSEDKTIIYNLVDKSQLKYTIKMESPKMVLYRLVKEIRDKKGLSLNNINNFYLNWKDDLIQIAIYSIHFFNFNLFND